MLKDKARTEVEYTEWNVHLHESLAALMQCCWTGKKSD